MYTVQIGRDVFARYGAGFYWLAVEVAADVARDNPGERVDVCRDGEVWRSYRYDPEDGLSRAA